MKSKNICNATHEDLITFPISPELNLEVRTEK
jgi:hypothetical protein